MDSRGNVIDTPLPDGPSTCPMVFQQCSTGSDALISCAQIGQPSTTTPCNWGCIGSSAGSAAHCGVLVPGGGAVTGSDFSATAPDALSLSGTIDAAGKINGTTWSSVSITNGVTIFRFNHVHVTGTVNLTGSNAIALVANGTLVVDALIDGRPATGCLTVQTGIAGPGGFAGGTTQQAGIGSGGGMPGSGGDKTEGGGGGGNGGSGGSGGSAGPDGPAGGAAYGSGDPTIAVLVGGGGGGGADGGGAVGGGGGAALQLASNVSIAIGSNGAINLGGCGGHHGGGNDSGGGGGAGGTLLIEAPMLTLVGVLAANGGGGGGGSGGTDGSAGSTDAQPAPGGARNTNVAVGGSGAAGATITGDNGTYSSQPSHSGGGGGGAGRIRLETRTGSAMVGSAAILSPDLTTTAATLGSATVK